MQVYQNQKNVKTLYEACEVSMDQVGEPIAF